MVAETSIIETGVDKLVNLVNSKGRISSYDAVKELGVSVTIIMEWADFLEEEGIIKVEYKFTKVFLVAKKLGKKDVRQKSKEFSEKKDVFIRKAGVSLNFLGKEAAKLKIVKEEFDKIKKELGFDISSVKNELQVLEKYENLKVDLDRKIGEQKRVSMDKIEVMTRQILSEKNEYNDILLEIDKEEATLEKEKQEVKSLEESEKLIRERLNGLKEMIKNVENKTWKGEEDINLSEKNIQRLILMARDIRNKVEKEKRLIGPLIEKSEEQTRKIKELQTRVINKIEEKEKKLEDKNNVSKRLKDLFNEKMGFIKLVEELNKNRNDLEKDLVDLIKKAKSFQISSKNADMESQIADIEKKFNKVDSKKRIFENELKKLSSFFK